MKSVIIKDIKLHIVALPLVELLKTSFGAEPYKSAIIIEVVTEQGLTGWGETALKNKTLIWRGNRIDSSTYHSGFSHSQADWQDDKFSY